jgi:MSHA biogenesis protein MshI
MEIPQFAKLFKQTSRSAGWAAITLSKEGVHVARVIYVGTRPQVTKCSFFPLTEVTASALDRIRKDVSLDTSRFITLLSPNEYQLFMVDAPNVPADELKTAIRWKIKDLLNYHVDDATIDVLKIPANKYGGDRPQSLYAVAASNETVRKCVALFEKARIELNVIDIPEMAHCSVV